MMVEVHGPEATVGLVEPPRLGRKRTRTMGTAFRTEEPRKL